MEKILKKAFEVLGNKYLFLAFEPNENGVSIRFRHSEDLLENPDYVLTISNVSEHDLTFAEVANTSV